MKKDRTAELFLEQLRKIPIVQVACEKVDVSRNTVYRELSEFVSFKLPHGGLALWLEVCPAIDMNKLLKDAEFAKAMDEALVDGEAVVNDMSESQLLSKIKNGEWPPIAFWLRKRHPKFKDRLEIIGTLQGPQEELTPEEEAVVKEALRLASLSSDAPVAPPTDNQEHEPDTKQSE